MTLLQICTTPLGQGLQSLATLMFKMTRTCAIMPVLDQKPIGEDYDDKHHSRLLERQHKDNNDALPILASIPIGSAVVVQQEDGRLWTHRTVVNMQETTTITAASIHHTTHYKWQKNNTQ